LIDLPGLLTASRPVEGGFVATVPDTWLQGRTAYGGLSSAFALEAARRVAPDLPPLRSAQITFAGPLAGEVTATARLLRQGRNAAFVQADVAGEAGVGLTATFVFMRAMDSQVHVHDLPSPDVPSPEHASDVGQAHTPFAQNNMDVRFALPRKPEPAPDVSRWIRLKGREGLDPMVELLAVGDALPPAVMPLFKTRAPVSSMTWLVNLLTPAPVTRDGWYLLRSTANYAENGCTSQSMHIWNADGVPIATGMQSIALFG
jgi:acyl-CoA thioesterase